MSFMSLGSLRRVRFGFEKATRLQDGDVSPGHTAAANRAQPREIAWGERDTSEEIESGFFCGIFCRCLVVVE